MNTSLALRTQLGLSASRAKRMFVYSATSAPPTGPSSLGVPVPLDAHATKKSDNATIQPLQARITLLQGSGSHSGDRRTGLPRHPLLGQRDDRALHREGTAASVNRTSNLARLAEGGDRVHRRVDFVFRVEEVNREPQVTGLTYRGAEDVPFVSEPVVDLGGVAA